MQNMQGVTHPVMDAEDIRGEIIDFMYSEKALSAIFDLLESTLDTVDAVINWLRRPNDLLDGERPIDCLELGNINDVLKVIAKTFTFE